MKNSYEIINNDVIFYVTQRNGNKFQIIFDLDDFDRIKEMNLSWHVSYYKKIDGYYAQATEYLGIFNGKAKNKRYFLHRIIMNAKKNQDVDHINHNTLDNRKSNLRLTNRSNNSKNRSKLNKNNISGYRNVCRVKDKWIVQLQIDGVNTKLGSFDDVREAGEYAEEMRKYYYKEFAGN